MNFNELEKESRTRTMNFDKDRGKLGSCSNEWLGPCTTGAQGTWLRNPECGKTQQQRKVGLDVVHTAMGRAQVWELDGHRLRA